MPAVNKAKASKTLEELLGSSSDEFEESESSDDTFDGVEAQAPAKKKAKVGTPSTTKRPSTSPKKSTQGTKTTAPVSRPTSGKATPKTTPAAHVVSSTGDKHPDDDSYTVVLPSSWMATGNPPLGECSLLIQVEPEDATRFDYEGVSGAMGRLEAGANGIVLDLKGRQYQASLLPGPTCMLVGLSKGALLKVEGMTDEFASLVQTHDVMAKLDAIVTGAKLDEGYQVMDENVNRVDRSKGDAAESSEARTDATSRKRGASKSSATKPVAKRKKT